MVSFYCCLMIVLLLFVIVLYSRTYFEIVFTGLPLPELTE